MGVILVKRTELSRVRAIVFLVLAVIAGLLPAANASAQVECYAQTCEECQWSEGQQKWICKIKFTRAFCTCVLESPEDCWYWGDCRIIV
jgi:hypothetical protein